MSDPSWPEAPTTTIFLRCSTLVLTRRAAEIGLAHSGAGHQVRGSVGMDDAADLEDVPAGCDAERLTCVLLDKEHGRSARADVLDHAEDRLHEDRRKPQR